MIRIRYLGLAATFVLSLGCGFANAQSKTAQTNNLAQSRATLIQSTQAYKTTTQELVRLQQAEVDKAAKKLEQLRQLVAEGLVARLELEQAEQVVTGLRAKLESTQAQIADSDRRMAEIRAQAELEKSQSLGIVARSSGSSKLTPTLLRYTGSGGWSISKLGEIQSFFLTRFGHVLPTSAIGQSLTHNQLGLDHRNAVDVSLHPDSAEGKALISYLENKGIPFLAFRSAIVGVATGPHIHIGLPSHRLV